MNENILILGGGYGGALAAARIAKRGVPVTLVDMGSALVERIRLHQVAAGDEVAPVPYPRIFRDLPVETVQARVIRIDRERKLVHTTVGDLRYDKLVYALGSVSETPEHAVSVANPLAVRARLRDAKHVVVVGGGLTGIELTSEIAERHPHLDVTLVDGGTLGGDMSPRARRHLSKWMEEHHVTVVEHTRVASVEPDGVTLLFQEDDATGHPHVRQRRATSAAGRAGHLFADVVLWCGAFRVPEIAREAGLETNARGQVVVDEYLRSSDPSIYAIGDAAACSQLRMGCAVAMPMGGYVADLLTGATDQPFDFGFVIRCISLGRHDGIIQFVHPDDSPKELALTGRPAAWVKELVCRFTVLSVKLETHGVHYRWPKAEAA